MSQSVLQPELHRSEPPSPSLRRVLIALALVWAFSCGAIVTRWSYEAYQTAYAPRAPASCDCEGRCCCLQPGIPAAQPRSLTDAIIDWFRLEWVQGTR